MQMQAAQTEPGDGRGDLVVVHHQGQLTPPIFKQCIVAESPSASS
jgi:hypothetical protein